MLSAAAIIGATPGEDDVMNGSKTKAPFPASAGVVMHTFSPWVTTLCLLMASRLGGASVAGTFAECAHFFYTRTPPAGLTGSGLSKICQRYANEARYATLYDGARRLPRYSAYVFKKTDGRRRMDTPWMYEPQLVSKDSSGNMRAIPLTDDTPPLIQDGQTVLEDYTDAVDYRRAPLNPDLHQSDPDDKSSTYTLTNVVPLVADFLEASWEPYLDLIRRRLNNFCQSPAFVVTGVTVSGKSIQRGNRERLTIPGHVWLAYCCPRFDRNSPYEVRFMFPSYGGYATNARTEHGVAEVPLKMLESFLKNQANADSEVTIFYQGCASENSFKKKREVTSVRWDSGIPNNVD